MYQAVEYSCDQKSLPVMERLEGQGLGWGGNKQTNVNRYKIGAG